MLSDGNDMLSSIPMPGSEPPPPPSKEGNAAWEKAQQALKKITAKARTKTVVNQSVSVTTQLPSAQVLMMQYYPWIAAQQYGMQYAPTPNYALGYEQQQQQQQQQQQHQQQQQQNRNAINQQWKQQQSWTGSRKQWNNNRQPQQHKQAQSLQNSKKFVPFSIAVRTTVPDAQKTVAQSPSVVSATQSPGGLGVMPENVRRYVERAYLAAQCAEDRQKVQEYLEKRLRPLLQAGTTRAIDWDREPLPHERGYELPTTWTPAATLRASLQANIQKNNALHYSRRERKRTASPDAGSDSKRSRRSTSSSSSDVEVIKVKSIVTKKKNKKEKKREDHISKKEKRKQNQSDKQKKEDDRWHVEEDTDKIEQRSRRFADDARVVGASVAAVSRPVRMKLVKGTCQSIEKSFFRLTAAPDPGQVRPLEVLEKSLENVKEKYRSGAPYRYLSDQLRSIRQDLTVQRVRNKFTVLVYEINARIALENKDREEFNKCQSQLKLLYHEVADCPNEAEFIAYRLLYYIAMSNTLDISSLLKGLQDSMRNDECVSFALRVRRAVSLGSYRDLFRLFKKAPRMCSFIMDLFVERERKAAVTQIIKAFRPTVPVSKVSEWLGMSESSLVEWLNLLEIECEVGGTIDCRVYATKTL